MPKPDFLIVGAFKSGSTALYEGLRRHPQIFMPFHKEPLYFGDDLTRRYGRYTEAEYLRLFDPAKPGQKSGEASTWYLYSVSAAREIHDFNPEMRIMVVLRNPVDVMYAEHSQLIYNVIEEGSRLRLQYQFPSSWFAFENGQMLTYLPRSLQMTRAELNEQTEALIRKTVVIGVPEKYRA